MRKALTQRAAAGVDSDLPPGLRVDEPQVAHVGQLLLARIADLDRQHLVATHHFEQRLAPVERSAEVGDDRNDPALSRDRTGAAKRRAERGRSELQLLRLALERAEQPEQAVATLVRRQRRRVPVAERHHAEAVAAPGRDVAERDRHPVGDVGLAPVGRAEMHRRRRVEQEPRDEHALGHVDAHVRLAHARRHVPLDAAHVVAGDVRSDLRELDSLAVVRRAVVAREHSLQAAADLDLEGAQGRSRKRPRSGAFRRRCAKEPAASHQMLGRASVTSGTGTAASTLSRIVSGVIPSARA